MKGMEIWLCRVVLRPGFDGGPMMLAHLNEASNQRVQAKVIEGELGVTQDGYIVEPLQSYATEELAHEAHARVCIDDPRRDYRVILSVPADAVTGVRS